MKTHVELTRSWRERNRAKSEAQRRRRYARRVADGTQAAYNRRYYLAHRWKLTLEQYDEMLEGQGGGCAICGIADPGSRAFHVDHDHETGTIRGLLCKNCNHALGRLLDEPRLVEQALLYLLTAQEVTLQ